MYHLVSRGNRREDIRWDAWVQTGRRVHVRCSIAYSDAGRTPIPIHIGQAFQLKSDTGSD